MYATANKKMLNMLILDILKEYSDEEHRLTQQEIVRLLEANYDMKCDRRSVKNNILYLRELGYEISMDDGYYLMERDFEDAELRMLVDCVLFAKNLTQRQAKGLIEKLKAQGNRYFSAKLSHVCNLPDLQHTGNKQFLYALDVVNDAISAKKKISFIYNVYDTDLKLHPKREEAYIVNPYQIAANNGHFYLICNYDKYDDVSHYRLDRMTCVKMLDEDAKPYQQIKGFEYGFNFPKHMSEHIYMYGGPSVRVKLLTTDNMMNELVDWFGKNLRIVKTNEDEQIEVTLHCNEEAMFYWALQYGLYVEIIEPMELRSKISTAIKNINEKYNRTV